MSRNKVNKETQLKACYTVGGDGVSMGIYSFQTADGKNILIPARDSRDLTQKEKAQLRHVKETLANLTTGDLLLLFENKEEGLEFLAQDEIPLLDLHTRINATEDMKYFNMLANKVTEFFLSEIVNGSLFLTTAISSLTEEAPDGTKEDIICNLFIDQGSNTVYTFVVDPTNESLAQPLEAAVYPTAEIMCMVMDDINFRIHLAKDPVNEAGIIETPADYLVPMESTMEALVRNGLIKFDMEV